MPKQVYPATHRYQVQWQGMSGNWWHRRYYRFKWVAVIAAVFEGTGRVLDHKEESK